ncbi:hypothetical protein J3R83DRAFT_13281 [Lanmaoa asiatica]|nr:hypothetical protein J3R83DRAFT_13281 [Lanmaoa asiatica]
MSPWPGAAGGLGVAQAQFQYPPSLPQHSLVPLTRVSNESCATTSTPRSPTLTPANLEADIPEVIPWFTSLEQRVKKPPCGVKFGELGVELESKGFVQISQLLHHYISTQTLQDLLGIEIGTVILILQYVDADLQALYAQQ